MTLSSKVSLTPPPPSLINIPFFLSAHDLPIPFYSLLFIIIDHQEVNDQQRKLERKTVKVIAQLSIVVEQWLKIKPKFESKHVQSKTVYTLNSREIRHNAE